LRSFDSRNEQKQQRLHEELEVLRSQNSRLQARITSWTSLEGQCTFIFLIVFRFYAYYLYYLICKLLGKVTLFTKKREKELLGVLARYETELQEADRTILAQLEAQSMKMSLQQAQVADLTEQLTLAKSQLSIKVSILCFFDESFI